MPLSVAALKAEHFAKYPPEARALAGKYVPLLRELPLAFLPLLLREVIEYDWKFPVERRDLERQLRYLESLSADARGKLLAEFAALKLSPALEQMDWVGAPLRFSEQLTAFLWTSHQIDAFRKAAVVYVQKLDEATPHAPLPVARLGIVLVGRDVTENKYPLFRKLRPHGVYFTQVDPRNGVAMVLDAVARRARAHPAPFAHWYIDGGTAANLAGDDISKISYPALSPVRAALLDRIRKIAQAHSMGPEGVVATLAQMQPEELGLSGASALNHFQVDLLTQGSGTQVFSTTFVQWAAREALRRAQPLTLLARFAPRQREHPMNELLAGTAPNELDAHGALIDGDMGGYYTWLNQQRLSEAEKASFIVWFEGHGEALAIGPSHPRGAVSAERVTLEQILQRTT
jgi:hypothetical protein